MTATRQPITCIVGFVLICSFPLGCVKGPTGPAGVDGADGLSPSAASVAKLLVRDHVQEIRGPQGEAGVSPTAEQVAAVLARDYSSAIKGPKGDKGLDAIPPTPSAVAADLVANHLPEIRGPASTYTAVDAHGQIIGQVTGVGTLLWNEQIQGYIGAPSSRWGPGLPRLDVPIPPGFTVWFRNLGCPHMAGQMLVEYDWKPDNVALEPLYFGGGISTLYGTYFDRPPITASVESREGSDGICVNDTQTLSNLLTLDLEVSLPGWFGPMSLVPTVLP